MMGDPLEYLAIGHVTEDLTPEGVVVGGTVAFAGLTAHAFGKNVGIITAAAPEFDLESLNPLNICVQASVATTAFQNVYGPHGRQQKISAKATDLSGEALPDGWFNSKLVHWAPVANEIGAGLIGKCAGQWVCLTPQGWLRRWDHQGNISLLPWHRLRPFLSLNAVVVLSLEDIGGTLEPAAAIARECMILAITMGAEGAMVYAEDKAHRLAAPKVEAVDPTGCGDIFAAAFFIRLEQGDDPWRAASVANHVAAMAATRKGLESIPGPIEIEAALQLRS